MKWIKALEKLPPVGMDCNLKINNVPFSGRYWDAEREHMSHLSYEHFNVAGKSILSVSNFHIIEWLDESACIPSSSVTGEEWISLKEYEQKALQLLSEKPVIKMLVQNGLPFEKWGNNIHNLIDKELGATRELRVKMPSSVTGESEVIVGCQHPFKEVRQQGLNFFCDKCKEWF